LRFSNSIPELQKHFRPKLTLDCWNNLPVVARM